MARTQADIKAEIDTAIDNDTTLSDASMDSAASNVSILSNLFAFLQSLNEKRWAQIKPEIVSIAANLRLGTRDWYGALVKAWQTGDVLPAGATTYDPIDEAKQIAEYVAVRRGTDPLYLNILVAKDSGGVPNKLTSGEKTSLEGYLDKVKLFGDVIGRSAADLGVLSEDADVVTLNLTLQYSAMKDQAEFQSEIEAAIKAYFADIDFAGKYRYTSLVDAMQKVEGFVDVDSSTITFVDFNTVNTSNPLTYEFSAGYAVVQTINLTLNPV